MSFKKYHDTVVLLQDIAMDGLRGTWNALFDCRVKILSAQEARWQGYWIAFAVIFTVQGMRGSPWASLGALFAALVLFKILHGLQPTSKAMVLCRYDAHLQRLGESRAHVTAWLNDVHHVYNIRALSDMLLNIDQDIKLTTCKKRLLELTRFPVQELLERIQRWLCRTTKKA